MPTSKDIAKRLYKVIKKRCKNTIFLDGDTFRDLNNNDLKYTLKANESDLRL